MLSLPNVDRKNYQEWTLGPSRPTCRARAASMGISDPTGSTAATSTVSGFESAEPGARAAR